MSGIGIISIFFDVQNEDNPFFDFLDGTSPLDLKTLIPIDFSMRQYLMGYVGTNTVPNCERGVCWYFVRDVMFMS